MSEWRKVLRLLRACPGGLCEVDYAAGTKKRRFRGGAHIGAAPHGHEVPATDRHGDSSSGRALVLEGNGRCAGSDGRLRRGWPSLGPGDILEEAVPWGKALVGQGLGAKCHRRAEGDRR